MMVLIWESKVAKVEWEAASGCVKLSWKGFAAGADFREALDKGLEVFREKRARRWLGDTREMSAIAAADQAWVNEDWFPRLIGAGLSRMAVVTPTSVLAKLGVTSILDSAAKASKSPWEMQYFDDVERARGWLVAA